MGMKKDKDYRDKNKEAEDQEKNQNPQSGNAAGQTGGKASTDPEQNAEELAGLGEEAIPMVMLPVVDIERLRTDAKSNLENWQRERADFMNFKRRIEREQQQLNNRITGDIVKKILPALDDLERALNALPHDSKVEAWSEGIDLIYRKLKTILEVEGVTKISGGAFDPNIHEAISLEASPDHESGEIIEIVQQGYMLGDRVLRPAQVRVAQ